MTASTAGVKAPNHFVRLVWEQKEDLRVWHSFLEDFNGWALWMPELVSNFDLDAASSTGFGGFFQGRWSAGPWLDSWKEAGFLWNLVLLELFLVVLAVERVLQEHESAVSRGQLGGCPRETNRVLASSPPVVRMLQHLVYFGEMRHAKFNLPNSY